VAASFFSVGSDRTYFTLPARWSGLAFMRMTSSGDNKFCLKQPRVMPLVGATSDIAMKSARPESRTLSSFDGGAYGEVAAPGERRLASERRSAELLLYNLSLICSALAASATSPSRPYTCSAAMPP
jgi:hypothetical protein